MPQHVQHWQPSPDPSPCSSSLQCSHLRQHGANYLHSHESRNSAHARAGGAQMKQIGKPLLEKGTDDDTGPL